MLIVEEDFPSWSAEHYAQPGRTGEDDKRQIKADLVDSVRKLGVW